MTFPLRHFLGAFLFVAAPLLLPAEEAADADWWRDAVFYQIFVRSFADASTGPLAGDGVGDFVGLRERLDYLNDGDPTTDTDLGIDAIWLLPIHPSPTYHGYDVLDYKAINPDYGTMEDFQAFLAAAHERGIRVIIDLVLNHLSSEHDWFKAATDEDDLDSPWREWFRFADEPLNDTGPWGERAWHYRNGEYYYGVFWSGMPDLNFRHPPVTEYFKDVARFWLVDQGLDGFRLDAIRFFFENELVLQDLDETKQWLADFHRYCTSLKPDVFIVGEAWADTDQVASYVAADSVDTAFEFDLAKAFLESVKFNTATVYEDRRARLADAYGNDTWASFLANHDKERTLSTLEGDRQKARLAASLQLLDRGIPFIYYGEEIGMQGRKPDPDLRTPMQWADKPGGGFTSGEPWRAVNPDLAEVNVAALQARETSLWHHYEDLIDLRHAYPAVYRGSDLPLTADGRSVYTYARREGDTIVVFLANFRNRPTKRWSLSLDASPIDETWKVREVIHGIDVGLPELSAEGGFSAWKPMEEAAAETAYLFVFTPSQP